MTKNDDYLKIKRNFRDSVFHAIISKPKYLKRIYLSLHPEDETIRVNELKLIKSETVFIGGTIHDCCFTVRDEKVIFIEVQSTLCKLLRERMLIYYAEVLDNINKDFLEKQYSVGGTRMLETEFWVVHVGDNPEAAPEFYKTKFDENKLYVPLKVKTEYNTVGFLHDYCLLSALFRVNHENKGQSQRDIVASTLKECLEQGVMTEFLNEHYKEVAKIMLKSNEFYFKKYVEGLTKEARAEGKANADAANLKKLEKLLKEKGFSASETNNFIRDYNAIQ